VVLGFTSDGEADKGRTGVEGEIGFETINRAWRSEIDQNRVPAIPKPITAAAAASPRHNGRANRVRNGCG
jgi:hypothetical protein